MGAGGGTMRCIEAWMSRCVQVWRRLMASVQGCGSSPARTSAHAGR